jgi:hypothetical protein
MKAEIHVRHGHWRFVMKGCRLCHYTKSDGKVCGSPAMKRRTYCYFHLEAVQREKRMARWRLMTRLAPNLAVPMSAIEIKNLVSKVFGKKVLRVLLA